MATSRRSSERRRRRFTVQELEPRHLLSLPTSILPPTHVRSASINASDLSTKLLKANYSVTQGYLIYNSINPTPDHKHAGIDFGAPAGRTVYAATGGKVLTAGGDYGTVAVYDGTNTVIYLHLKNIRVSSGKTISAGTNIGDVGNTGTSKAHLHVEVRRGQHSVGVGPTSGSTTSALTLDPLSYLG